MFRIQSDRLLELGARELQFFLLQVGESQIVMSGVGTRIQLDRHLVVLDRFCNLAALKLGEPQQKMRIRALRVDFDCLAKFLESNGRIACRESCLGIGQVGPSLGASGSLLLCASRL